jgi:hypothetical protein
VTDGPHEQNGRDVSCTLTMFLRGTAGFAKKDERTLKSP